MVDIIGASVVLLGSIFLLLASIGVIRMPDPYNRIQAGTKATTLGTILVFIGIGVMEPSWFPKIVIIFIFIIFTNPVSSHVLARAAYNIKIALTKRGVVDQLKEHRGTDEI